MRNKTAVFLKKYIMIQRLGVNIIQKFKKLRQTYFFIYFTKQKITIKDYIKKEHKIKNKSNKNIQCNYKIPLKINYKKPAANLINLL